MNLTTADYITTYTGQKVNVFDPDLSTIKIEDIAHALSFVPRFAGHTSIFFSVAEHSINCAKDIEPEYALEALLHDATEAYICDLAKPIKSQLPGYVHLEANLMRVIAIKFNLTFPLPDRVKTIDTMNLYKEYDLYVRGDTTGLVHEPMDKIEKEFLDMYYLLNEFRTKR